MPKHFDYIIIGGGLAGLQLALQMGTDRFFEQRSIAIIDPDPKTTNDKTWCFWEKGESHWDKLITKKWDSGLFFSSEERLHLELDPYSYKMLRSLDFYKHVRSRLSENSFIHFIQDEITEIDKAATVAYGAADSYSTLHIFDSRVPSDYLEEPGTTTIFQHFKGWVVETSSPVFDPSEFTMMDYRLKFKDSTSFTYVLPLTKTKALVEFTFFTPFLTEDAIYDEYLEKYLREVIKIKDYKVTETEKGIIPMTDYDFHKHSSSKITKIGTAGSWVKGSTGYSFKHTEKKVAQIIENIKKGKGPEEDLINKRFRKYDAIFLDVLNRNNHLGERIFTKFYKKNSPVEIFKYLDEETTIKEELKIMFSLFHPQFLASFFRNIK